ncbi:unnamed protein product [Arctia plantaginis]|uniref:Uncharacterized protein n=1 Tax=Arctia plantaginis TaxID=874455 RepID=A0A8S1AN68_ARCPL|nr:unnamed protein product [Arctia plantaginis]
MIPGIPTVGKYDSNYVDNIVLKTRRNGRNSDYALSVEFTSKHGMGNNNVSIHLIFYEYLHNEYRPSFVEMHYKICDLILKDTIFGPVIRRSGMTVCPLPAGRYHMMNLTFNEEFPSIWPFEKGKLDFIAKHEPSAQEFARANVVLSFKMIK